MKTEQSGFSSLVDRVHPDPDSLLCKRVYNAFEEIERLSDEYAKEVAIDFSEWLELEGYRIKGMDEGQRDIIYKKYQQSKINHS